jgi:glycosyltransferase involved in cell wall biosynthesis
MIYPRNLSRKQIWKNQTDFYWLSLFFEPFKPILKFFDKLSFTSSHCPVLVNGYFIGREFEKVYQTAWKGCPSGAPFVKRKNGGLNNNVFKGEIRAGKLKIKKPYLLYVGRHEVWKRIDLAIKVLAEVVKNYPDVRLVVRGPFSAHTKDFFSPGGSNQKELKKLYFNAAAYVFPSKKEDFGIVIIEAMGAGVPVVAWNSGGPTDIIVHGKTGFLAKPFSLNDFAKKTLKILQDKKLRQKMSRASRQRVKNHFSWQRHLDILEKAIKKVIK